MKKILFIIAALFVVAATQAQTYTFNDPGDTRYITGDSLDYTFGRFDSEIRVTDTNEDQFGDREDARIVLSVSTTFK